GARRRPARGRHHRSRALARGHRFAQGVRPRVPRRDPGVRARARAGGGGGGGRRRGRSGAGRARWLGEMRPLLAENLRRARASCGGPAELGCDGAAPTAATLAARARAFVEHVPGDVEPWLAAARAFHRTYAAEQLRLASLFPRITSEVLTFDARERNGTEMADGDFLITFDDGPTAA